MGYLADRWARKHVMLLIYVIVALRDSAAASSRRTPAALYVFALLFGIGLGGDYMIIPLMAADLFGVRALGRVMGIVLTADGVAEAMAPMMVAALRDHTGRYHAGFVVLIALAAIGALAVALLPSPGRTAAGHGRRDVNRAEAEAGGPRLGCRMRRRTFDLLSETPAALSITRMPRSVPRAQRSDPTSSAQLSDEELLDLQIRQLDIRIEGSELEPRIDAAARGAGGARPDLPPALLAVGRVVHARRHSRASPSRSTWRTRAWRSSSSRRCSRSRAAIPSGACASCATRRVTPSTTRSHCAAAEAARALRQPARGVPGVLRAEAVQQELRAAPRRVVRAEPSRRGLRRDLRGVADARARDWEKRYTAGRRSKKLQYMDRLMQIARRRAQPLVTPARRSTRCTRCARRCASTIAASGGTTASTIRLLRSRPAAAVLGRARIRGAT